MPNEVTIRVRTQDDTAAARAKTKSEFQKLGRDVSSDLDRTLTAGGRKAGQDLGSNIDKGAKEKAGDTGSVLGKLLAVGITAAAPLAGAAIIAGVGAGFIGLAVMAQKSNVRVAAAFKTLSTDVVAGVKGASDQVAPYLTRAAESLDKEFASLGPQLKTAFSYAGPDLQLLVQGVNSFATNAMPGMVAAAKSSQPVFQGLSVLLGDLGSSLTNLVGGFTSHSTVLGQAFIALGGFLKNLTATVGSFVGGALPGLGAGLTSVLGTFNALLSGIRPIAPILGAVTGAVLPVVGSFKAFSLLSGPVGSLGTSLSGLSDKAGSFVSKMTGSASVATATSNAVTKLGSSVSSAANALPLLGAAFTVVDMVAQHFFGDSQQLAQQLLAGGQASEQAAQKLAQNTATSAALHESLGGLGGFLADTFIPTTNDVEKGMSAVQIAQVNYNVAVAGFGPNSTKAVQAAKAYAAAQQTSATQTRDLSTAAGTLTAQLDVTASGTHLLSNSLQAASNAMQNLNSFASAVQTQMKELADHGMEQADDATSGFYQALDQLLSSLHGTKGPITDLNGNLNLTSQRGRSVLTALEAARGQMVTYASAMVNAHQPQSALNAGLNRMYSGLVSTMEKMGINAGEAKKLARQYLAIPRNIETNIGLRVRDNATTQINRIIARNSGRVITLYVDSQSGTFRPGGTNIRGSATGGPISIPQGASGMKAGSGMALVGEHGAEIVRMPVGSQVMPNSNLPQQMREAGGGAVPVHVVFDFSNADGAFASAFKMLARNNQINITVNGQRAKVG